MKVMVTGGSGIVGHYVIDELLRAGHTVVNADRVRPGDLSHTATGGASRERAVRMREAWGGRVSYVQVDVTDYGQVVSALQTGVDGVVHLAAAPTNVGFTEEYVFFTNMMSMWNVMHACEQLGIRKVLLGSSYNAVGAMGTAMARWGGGWKDPLYLPLDEEHPTRAEEAYSVTKFLGEELADAFARRNPDMQLGSMRFNGMWDDDRMREMQASPITDPTVRAAAFWTYLHLRDAGRACRMALEADWKGHYRFFLNARDTILAIPTMEAIRRIYPKVPLRRPLEGFEAPIGCSRAREVFGWEPVYSWRDPQFAPDRQGDG